MIVQAPSPRGIDFNLQKFQAMLHAHLIEKWGLDALSPDYTCYDRCYRNQTKDGFTPEVYTKDGNYSDVLVNDKVKAVSFFGIGSNITYSSDDNSNQADVHLIFFVDLKKLKGKSNRADEEVRLDVQEFLQNEMFGMMLNGIVIGIDNVFTDYSGFNVNEAIKYRDLQPFHCFRFNFTNLYKFNQCTH